MSGAQFPSNDTNPIFTKRLCENVCKLIIGAYKFNWNVPFFIRSRIKWCLNFISVALECWAVFLLKLVALVLLRYIGTLSRWSSKFYKACLNHIIFVQHHLVYIYSIFVIDNAIELCFLLNQHTRHGPRKWYASLCFSYLYDTWQIGITLKIKLMLLGYHNPRVMVILICSKIHFTTLRRDTSGLDWYSGHKQTL